MNIFSVVVYWFVGLGYEAAHEIPCCVCQMRVRVWDNGVRRKGCCEERTPHCTVSRVLYMNMVYDSCACEWDAWSL